MPAVLSVLALLGAFGLVALGVLGTIWGLLQGNRLVVRRSLQLTCGVAATYMGVLAVSGLAGGRQVLPFGAEKYFCELDCHLAYSVEQVAPVEGAGSRGHWAVKVRTRFDERTTSPRRGDAPLSPNPRQLYLIGSDGNSYPAEVDLDPSLAASSTPITRALRPGEAYSTWVEFALPAGVKPARLEITEDLFVNKLMIGNERSLFHAPVLMALGAT